MDRERAMAAVVYFVCAFPVCVFPAFYAMGSSICYALCGKLRRCVAEDDTAVWFWPTVCCAALQATFGALALLLPSRSWRVSRASAYLTVAVILVGRCMYASVMPQGVPHDLKILIASGTFGLTVADLHSFFFPARGGQE
ncbi:hypothetical protein VPH35_087953 [Triticum aestivum]|uniref:uncharacterized protein n=1 Tax=Triticum aestivum TaxID=4565 RepID=UPI001D0064B1|nr:uncharacterized protein LOC123115548 [Triticum aestivum]XP_044392615.1 uncharacterized protein LOC123115548 [Triticum aestivum]XP_044392616.1 uncharacterized protein LOC123115548 [Triticum aestivum]XP_044392617.1 uncharacterized protein LOC123115548 [Triticum aestivum]